MGVLQRALIVAVAALACCDSPDTELVKATEPGPTPVIVPCTAAAPPLDADLPTIPVGLDAYRAWEKWPLVRIGARTYMRSTYDRAGGNEAADASHFIRQTASGDLVTLDVAGSGVLSFVRTNHWHGSPWHYVDDGADTVVSETSTADPDHPTPGSTFIPQALFPEPLALTWADTRGADLSWIPIPFGGSFELRYGRSHYGTGYYIYSLYAEGANNLSQRPCTWEKTPPPDDVRALLRTTAEELAPSLGKGVPLTGSVDVPASGEAVVQRLANAGPTTIRALAFEVASERAAAFGRATLRITWDDRTRPSIDAPVALFFGTGSLYARDAREVLVRALPVTIHASAKAGRTRFTTIFPMPFARSATIALAGGGEAVPAVSFELRTEPQPAPTDHVAWLHATYHDFPLPVRGQDNVLLDTTVDEGGGDFCGTFVGTSFTFSDRADLGTLEGDPRFFFDDSSTPQAQGTGTEEWAGGGDYFGGVTSTLALVGHPVGAPTLAEAKTSEDAIESAYRFLLADAMPFGKNARIQLEHGGVDDSTERYRAVTYWYGLPGACLVLADTLHVGDAGDEQRHSWSAMGASDVVPITSRYELGVVAPESTDTGRTVATRSSFRLAIPPDNAGVLLRRKLDYAIADQRAEVFIADDRDDAPFVRAGTWYLAGGTRSLFAFAPTETGVVAPIAEDSNRRFRDDEFLIARALTSGRSAIRVRIDVATAWSELRYSAYAWRLPPAP